MRILTLVFLLILPALASTTETIQVETVLKDYLKAIKSQDKSGLKSVVTDKYYSQLDKDNGVSKLFSLQKNDKKPIDVDIKVVKQKEGHRANIKNKGESSYDHYWFNVVSEKGKYKIDGTFHLEE